jgi:hypothetical protein
VLGLLCELTPNPGTGIPDSGVKSGVGDGGLLRAIG